MSTTKITLQELRLLIERVINESSFNNKIFYHGRKEGRRPYHGNYIYISDSFEYAAGYSDGKIVYEFKIPFSEVIEISPFVKNVCVLLRYDKPLL